MWITVNI